MMRRYFIMMLCLMLAPGAVASPSDSTVVDRFEARQLILPGALVAVGAFGAANGWMRHIDREITDAIGTNHRYACSDYLQFVGIGANVALGSIGVKARHSLRDRALVTATAWVALECMVQGVKRTVDRSRPDGTDDNSFPSGHAARAFLGAELVRMEYGTWYGAGAYALAAAVSTFRVCGMHHWTSDVIAGAGMGILAARVGSWLLLVEKRLFGLSDDRGMVVMPVCNVAERSVSMSFSMAF